MKDMFVEWSGCFATRWRGCIEAAKDLTVYGMANIANVLFQEYVEIVVIYVENLYLKRVD